VVGYCRVSTDKQVEANNSLPFQEDKIWNETNNRGWALKEILVDEGRSAKDLDRPNLQKALAMLSSGKCNILMVTKLDRLSRSVIDVCDLGARAKKEGWKLLILDINIDTTCPSGEMILTVLSALSQWERQMISARTKEGLSVVRSKGTKLGRPKVRSQELDDQILSLRAKNHTYQEIADILNEKRIKTPTGKGVWRYQGIQRILRDIEKEAEQD